MNYFLAIDFTLETICLLCMLTFGLGQPIVEGKIPCVLSAILTGISMVLIVSGIYGMPSFFLILVCLFPLYYKHSAFYFCWLIVYNLGVNMLFFIATMLYLILVPGYTQISKQNFDLIADDMILIAVIIFFFAIRHTKIERRETLRHFHTKEYVLLLVTCLLDFIILELTVTIFQHGLNLLGRQTLSITLILLIFVSIVIFYLFFAALRKNITLEETNHLNIQNLKLEEKYFKTLYRKNEDLRRFRHDFQNHVSTLSVLAQKQEWETLQKYLSDLSGIREQVDYIHTNSAIADAVVNEFHQTLPEGISIHIQGKFPGNMAIRELDISTILSNLLKNAREACELLDTASEKEISLEIRHNDRQLFICVENPSRKYDDAELKYLETSKPDRLNHGFGLVNIRHAVEKYQGSMTVQYRNQYFMVFLRLHYR